MTISRRQFVAGTAAVGFSGAISPFNAASSVTDKVLISQASQGFLYAPSYVAEAAGYFAQEGIAVEFAPVKVTGGPTTALAASQVQFAYAAASGAVLAQSQGVDLVAVGATVTRAQADIVVQPDYLDRIGLASNAPVSARIHALKGMRFAVNGFGGGLDQLVRYMVKSEGLDPERDLTLTAIAESAGVLAAFQHKRIDGFIFSAPTSTVAITQHGGRLLISLSRGDFDPLKNFLYGGLLAKGSWAAQNKDLTVRVLRAYTKSLKLIAENPLAAKQAMKPYFSGLQDDIYSEAFESLRPSYPTSPLIADAQYEQVVAFLRLVKSDLPDLPMTRYYDNSYAQLAAG